MPSPTEVGPLGPPPLIGQYKKHSNITHALQAHARENGYAITVNKTTPTVGAWICSKGGKYDPRGKSDAVHESKRRKNTGTTKTGCPFRVRATKDDQTGLWTSVISTHEHNHDAVAALSALPQHRLGSITEEERQKVAEGSKLGHSPTQILQALRMANPDSCLVARDIYNLLHNLRLEELAGNTPIEWLLKVYLIKRRLSLIYSANKFI
jgi:hypothetical protein